MALNWVPINESLGVGCHEMKDDPVILKAAVEAASNIFGVKWDDVEVEGHLGGEKNFTITLYRDQETEYCSLTILNTAFRGWLVIQPIGSSAIYQANVSGFEGESWGNKIKIADCLDRDPANALSLLWPDLELSSSSRIQMEIGETGDFSVKVVR